MLTIAGDGGNKNNKLLKNFELLAKGYHLDKNKEVKNISHAVIGLSHQPEIYITPLMWFALPPTSD